MTIEQIFNRFAVNTEYTWNTTQTAHHIGYHATGETDNCNDYIEVSVKMNEFAEETGAALYTNTLPDGASTTLVYRFSNICFVNGRVRNLPHVVELTVKWKQ